jgi:antitoxin VapB
MATYIKDDHTSELITELARRRGLTKQEAVKRAVQADLASDPAPMSFMDRLEKFWAEHPVPPPTGEVADKAFFDELSGEYERE